MPVPWFLIRHPAGDLVWDTGLPIARDLGAWAMPGPHPIDQLATLGLAPRQIRYLALSHGHGDHAGNAGLFAESTWIVNPAEHAYLFNEEDRAAPSMADYGALETANTRIVTGNHDVFGDGSVTIVDAPGHTPGHTVLLLRLPETGPILLSGDLWHLEESRRFRRVPTFNTDRAETLRSMDRVDGLLAATRARLVIQHEPAHHAELPQFPDSLG